MINCLNEIDEKLLNTFLKLNSLLVLLIEKLYLKH